MRFRLGPGLRSKINQTGIDYCYGFKHSKKDEQISILKTDMVLIQIFPLRKQWNQPTQRCVHQMTV